MRFQMYRMQKNDTYLVKDAYDKKTEERSVELSGDVMKLSFCCSTYCLCSDCSSK